MSETLNEQWIREWMMTAVHTIADNREYLIDLDRHIGDGDHGENMDRGFSAVRDAMESDDHAHEAAAALLKTVAKTLMSTVGGAAGPLYGTAFLRASQALTGQEISARDVVAMFDAALEGIQARGKAEEGEKTMVDAWGPAARAAHEAAKAERPICEILEAAARAAEEGVEATIDMQATKGRASYLGPRSAGHRDPGAASSAMIIRAAAKGAKSVDNR